MTTTLKNALGSALQNSFVGEVAGRAAAIKARGGGVNMEAQIAGNAGGLSGLFTNTTRDNQARYYSLYRDWPFVFINAISTRLSSLPFGAGTIKRDSAKGGKLSGTKIPLRLPPTLKSRTANGRTVEQLDSHPAIDFLHRPNRIQGKAEFLQCTIVNLYLTGEAYWIGGKTGENERELWAIPTSWITPKHEGGLFTSYVLKLPNQEGEGTILPKEVVHRIYFPDPADFKSTVSPVKSQIRAVKVDEKIQESQAQSFDSIFPQLMVTIGDQKGPDGMNMGPPTLTGPQRKQLVKGVREIVKSASRNRDPFIIDALITGVQKLNNSVQEMDYIQSAESVKKRISQSFGINPIVVGEMQGVNRAQAAVADQSYVDNVVNPIGDKITNALQDFVSPMFDGDNDTTSGLALWIEQATAKDIELDMSKARQGRQDGAVSRNEHRAILNQPPIDNPSNDLVGIASTVQGAAALQSLIVMVGTGQIPATAAQSMMTLIYGLAEDQAKQLLKGVKPMQPPMPGAGPGAGPDSGQGKPAEPPKPENPPAPEPPDDGDDGGKPLPNMDDATGKRIGRLLRKTAAMPKLTRSAVKSHNARLRASLEREAAAGLIPFFDRSSSTRLDDLLNEAIIVSTPTTRPPSLVG